MAEVNIQEFIPLKTHKLEPYAPETSKHRSFSLSEMNAHRVNERVSLFRYGEVYT